jgi:hypothetical protein
MNTISHGEIEAKRHGIERSPEWSKIEKSFVLRFPNCAACKITQSHVQVHHVFPFHYCIILGRPDLELDPRNLITLCETTHLCPSDNHHLLLGHFDDFKSANLNVRQDVIKYKGFNLNSIKNNSEWQEACNHKLKPLDEMTDEDRENFKHLMNNTYA